MNQMSLHSRISRRRVAQIIGSGAVASSMPWLFTAPAARAEDAIAANVVIPEPVVFPRDSGIHDDTATEWWYYTGHLFTEAQEQYGFEYVIFRARRGDISGFVSHFAITDNPAGKFTFAQQIVGADGVIGSDAVLDLDVNGWTMTGEAGNDRLRAAMDGYGINFKLEPGKPAAMHRGNGFIDYGNGTYSYYYSRTRMPLIGFLRVGDQNLRVEGAGWMDHQWGNFTTFEDGGWDWYAVQLDDDHELMLYVVHDSAGTPLVVDGSIVEPDGSLTALEKDDFSIEATGTWTSPKTGTTWPHGWQVTVGTQQIDISIEPTMPDQELDTRYSTGIIYWEGQSKVTGTRMGEPITGNAYVELTGYAPVEQAAALGPGATPVTESSGG
ncbi:MAG: lipocalin family protein [Thermomicrobiales bacterium]